MPIDTDELDHEDDPDVEEILKRAYADDLGGNEDDPDPPEPGVIDEDHDPDR